MYLVKDEAELVGAQRPLWWVRFTVNQTRSQTRHGAVVDHGAELEEETTGLIRIRCGRGLSPRPQTPLNELKDSGLFPGPVLKSVFYFSGSNQQWVKKHSQII